MSITTEEHMALATFWGEREKVLKAENADLKLYQVQYNELRKIIDDGSESATHADAVRTLKGARL